MTNNTMTALRHVDPATLIVGSNVRLDPRHDQEFLDSIAERGVIEPIICYSTESDRLVVLRGQRRTGAAVKVGLATVPVVVVDVEPDEVDRIVDQLTENIHRSGLTVAETAAAYEQLAAFGVAAEDIAKKASRPRVEVDQALTVASSTAARAAAEQHAELTLDQAAVLAEFEGDEAAIERLVDRAATVSFAYQLQRERDERASAAAKAVLVAELEERGVRIHEAGSYSWTQELGSLADDDGWRLTEETHADCPGAVVAVVRSWQDGTNVWRALPLCDDPEAHGHPRFAWGSSIATATAEEQAARDVEAKRLAELEEAWASATKVRRTWLAEFLQRKTPPPRAAAFVVESFICGEAGVPGDLERCALLHELLDVEMPDDWEDPSDIATRVLPGAADKRALVLAVGMVLCAYEAGFYGRPFNNPTPAAGRYLRYLQQLGYELSDVEQLACPAPDDDAGGEP